MPTNPGTELIAFDSVVIINCLEKKKGRIEWITPIIKRAENGEIKIVVCSMAYAETVRIKDENEKELADSKAIIQEFFDKPWIVPVATSIFIGEQAAELQRIHEIDCADAIHLASAVFAHAPVFLTNDGAHAVKKKRKQKPMLPLDKKIMVDGKPLRIMTPQDYDEMLHREAAPLTAPPFQDGERRLEL